MTAQALQEIGPYAVGELPQSLSITIQDAAGNAIDLTGFTAKFVILNVDTNVSAEGAGTPSIADDTNGITQYDWALTDLAVEGTFHAQMWVDDPGTQKYASEIFQFSVEEITTAPNFV